MAKTNAITRSKLKRARRLLQAGQLPEARALLSRLCSPACNDFDAWYDLSSVNGQLGLFSEAIAACTQAIALRPDHAGVYANLGNAQAAMGKLEKAIISYNKALELNPGDSTIHFNIGSAHYHVGLLGEAAENFRKAIELRPDNADAHYSLGVVLSLLENKEEAIGYFREAIKLNPHLTKAFQDLGVTLNVLGDKFEAERCYRQGLYHNPESIELHYGLAVSLRQKARFEEALASYEQVLQVHPGDARAIAGKAEVYEQSGDTDKAYACVRQLIDAGRVNAPAAEALLKICPHFECCDEAVNLAEQILAGHPLSSGDRQKLEYSLGGRYDKLGRYDKAFHHFRLGNQLSPARFDQAAHAAQIEKLIKAYSRDSMARLPRSTLYSGRPVFIVGMPRSGTSLTEQILSSHPAIHGAGELMDITQLANTLHIKLVTQNKHPDCLDALTQGAVDRFARQYLERLDSFSRDAARVTDKMPHNFHNLGLIALLFPQARVIHCQRDPIDTCLSIYFQSFSAGHPYATDLGNLGFYYRQYERLMQHWERVVDIPIMNIQYEELVADQERISRAMVEFCGLEWDERCLQFHKSDRLVATASYDQVRQPLYKTSVNRAKNYAPFITPLLEALGTSGTPVATGQSGITDTAQG